MPAKRSLGTTPSLTLIGALLLTTAFTVPAFAQIETVVVTAEKKAEDIQSTPIAVTAYSAQDLAAHQVNGFKDIQFSTPNVTYTKANFTGTNFQIRGIGTQVISGDAESGIAFNIDDVYYANAPVDTGQFYDLQSVEVLRGPQSTLYGRGATGGAVNVFSAKPQLDTFASSIDGSYGTYDTSEIKGMVNMPIITDELAVRVAADWVRHDGYATNIDPTADDRHPDSRDQWSARGLIRWQPTQDTTVDVIYSHANEDDTRMRGEKQLCHTDPSGVLGCLPDKLDNGPVNPNATFFNIPVSQQAMAGAFGAIFTGFGNFGTAGPQTLGLFNLTDQFIAPPGAVPSDPREVNSDFTPTLSSHSNAITGEVKQKINDWLDATLVGGYADGKVLSQESYTNSPGAAFDPALLAQSETTLATVLGTYAFLGLVPASYADLTNGPYAYVFSHPGQLPTSNFTNNGIIGGDINRYTSNPFAYDQSSGSSKQESVDLRFNSNFEGPVNFMVAAYYLNVMQWGDYYVGANTLDYGQTLFGAIIPPALLAAEGAGAPDYIKNCSQVGCVYGSPFYDNRTQRSTIESKALYGEVYWDAIPDSLKFTLGLRGTEDIKDNEGRITIFNGFEAVGQKNSDAALAQCNADGQAGCDFDPGTDGSQLFENTHRKFDKLTGRFVINYNPHWDLTDSTFLYASYARGYKAGGSNPGVQQGNLSGIPSGYEPETIDAYELGAKNTLLNGTAQANLTAWYYNYGGYQISSIIANTSVNTNINAFLGGLEGEFVWAPTERWQFNFNADWTQSSIGRTSQIDTRNPGGELDYALVVKDGTLSATNAQNCVLYHNDPGAGSFGADFATLSTYTGGTFYAPPGGINGLAPYGVPNASYGLCSLGGLVAAGVATYDAATDTYHLPGHFSSRDTATGGTLTGVPVNIQGNHLGNTPPFSISFGTQYTAPVGGGYNLVSRFDYFWEAAMYSRIFNGPADRIDAYGVANALFTLNAPDNQWYVSAYARNLFGGNHVTGSYLTSSSSGLWTGMFYGEPRTVGVTVGARF